jgi:alkaline phosphatase D
MNLRNPKIGPVIGLVTPSSARIMCGIQHCPVSDKPNCGWLRFRQTDADWQTSKRLRFNKNFYFTGVIEITDLEPNTEYEYQMGYLPDFSGAQIDDESAWRKVKTHRFTTQGSDHFHFCFGSCLRKNDDSRYGKALMPVNKLHAEKPLNMMLWLGDQVYNDKALFLTTNNSSREDFTELYEEFLCNKHVKKLLPSMPNYMVMDDHEIDDRFRHGVDEYTDTFFKFLSRKKDRVINGLLAFYSYQASHGPLFDTRYYPKEGAAYVKGQGDNQVPVKHYASVDLGNGIGLFLLDCRKDRTKKKIISKEQEEELKSFLSSDYRVKLVASSVTFLADTKGKPKKSDNWKKAPRQRKRIIEHILTNNIQNVVFVSGDVHSHFAATMLHEDEPTTVHQLVSGSLFWPTSIHIDWIRWFKTDVQFNKQIYGTPAVSLSSSLSDGSPYDFYANNAVGYADIQSDHLDFKIIRPGGEVAILARLPLSPE